jgi:hypothetical protein
MDMGTEIDTDTVKDMKTDIGTDMAMDNNDTYIGGIQCSRHGFTYIRG